MSLYTSSGKFSDQPSGKKGRAWWYVLLGLMILLALGALVLTVVRFLGKQEPETPPEEIQAAFTASAELPTVLTAPPVTAVPETETVPETTLPPQTVPDVYCNHIAPLSDRTAEEILPEYREKHSQNPEMMGWLTLDHTRIDYPVMQSPEDPDKYLHTNFAEQEEFRGLPFLDAQCTPESDQLIIYAHNMKDGSMFRDLYRYEQKTFWEKNPRFRFNTIYAPYEFEVMAVLYDRVYRKTDTCFKFYQFIDAEDEEAFNEAVAYYREHSLYDTGVTAQYGDQLMALVTCAYHTEEGKFIVVGRKVPEIEMDAQTE